VLVYFGATSVLLPLFLVPTLPSIDTDTYEVFLIFLSGFGLTFAYLGLEIDAALRS